jgi:hypothetical protein
MRSWLITTEENAKPVTELLFSASPNDARPVNGVFFVNEKGIGFIANQQLEIILLPDLAESNMFHYALPVHIAISRYCNFSAFSPIPPPKSRGMLMMAGQVTDAAKFVCIELVIRFQIIPARLGELNLPGKRSSVPPDAKAKRSCAVFAGRGAEDH